MNIRNFSESDKAMPAGVCHIFDSYINARISGQSAQDSHGWYLRFSFDCYFDELRVKIYLLVVDKVSFSSIWKCLFSVSGKGGLCIRQF